MSTIREAYSSVNDTWPVFVPPLTDWEAVRATSRLWKFALGTTPPLVIEATNKGRYSWKRRGKFMVVYKRGWKDLIHDLSHYFYHVSNPGAKPHTKFHARLERKLIKEVIKRGWLTGKLAKD